MKIGFVLDDTLDTPDGVQQYVLTLGAWLSAQGHEVRYLVGQTARTDIAGVHALSRNVRVRFNGNRMSMPLPAPRSAIRQVLAEEQFDVLHVQMPYSPFMARRVIAAAPDGTAVIGTFHIAPNSRLVTSANAALGWWLKRSLCRFDRIASVSPAAADFARRTFRIETEVVPNVVVVQQFAAAEPFSAERFGGRPMVMFLGRLVPRKGCRVFLEALVRLRAEHPKLDVHGVVAGRGPLEHELKNYAAANGLSDHVTFAGFVSEEDKARYLRSADAAVFPSSGGESFGIVLLEAMAAGRPVVYGADNPGYHAVLAPRPEALFPVGDAKALADKLYDTLADKTLAAGARSWQDEYVTQFDVAVVGAQLENVYSAALRQRR